MVRVSAEQTETWTIGHDPHGHDCPAGNSQRAWNRIERCTGIEPASSVWKTEALTIVLTPQTGIRTPYQKADSLADATGFEPGSPPTGGGVLPLHQRPAWLRVMIVRPMRLPDRGFITTEAGRDSNGSVFTECGNRQKYGTRALRWNRTNDLPVMSRVL